MPVASEFGLGELSRRLQYFTLAEHFGLIDIRSATLKQYDSYL